jgi:O-antigen/teichoic acid export membrane protein
VCGGAEAGYERANDADPEERAKGPVRGGRMTDREGGEVSRSESELRSVAREGGWAGVMGLASAALRYVNIAILTRVLGAQAYGLYALANTVQMVLAIFLGLGLPATLVHDIASLAELGEWSRLRSAVRKSFVAATLAGVAGMTLVVALAPWVSVHLFHKPALVVPLVGLSLALPLSVLYSICSGGLQGFKRIRAKVFFDKISHPLFFTLLLVFGWPLFRNVPYVLAAYGVAALLTFFLAARSLSRYLSERPSNGGGQRATWGGLLGFSLPVMGQNFLSLFLLQSDLFVMGRYRGAAELAVYAVASRLAQQAMGLATDALSASLAPSFSALMGRNDPAGLRRLFHTSTRWLCLVGGAIGLTLLLGGFPVLGLFGPAFRQGYGVLCILVLGQMVSAAFGANGTLITMTGHPKVNLANSMVLGLGNLGLCLLLVPRYGAFGAASAAAASLIVTNLVRAIEIRWILKMGPWDRTILKPFAVLGAGAAAGGLATLCLHPLVGAAAGVAVYLLVWYGMRPEPEDWDMLRSAWGKLRRGAVGD